MPTKKVGRPPKYTSKEEIEKLINDYFEECGGIPFLDEERKPLVTDKGHVVYKKAPKPPTVTGLALALGFATRLSLLNYQGKAEFMNTITRAKSYIEEYAEQRLFDKDGVQGAKFSLINNFKGWSDKGKENEQEPLRYEDDPITKSLKEDAENGLL